MKIRYKVLRNDLTSPYQQHTYELNHWYEEPEIGQPGVCSCQVGLYCGMMESLLYRGVWRPGESVYRCEVKGRQAGEPPLKECYERMKILNRMTDRQVKALARRHHKRLGYRLEECLYPINPLKIERGPPTKREIELVAEWATVWQPVRQSVWQSVGDSVWQPVRQSVWQSVGDSVWDLIWGSIGDSVRDSVRDSAYAYIGSLFPDIQQWENVDHQPGIYPFQAGADLWRAGLVPNYNGSVWRLHSGPDAETVWTGTL